MARRRGLTLQAEDCPVSMAVNEQAISWILAEYPLTATRSGARA